MTKAFDCNGVEIEVGDKVERVSGSWDWIREGDTAIVSGIEGGETIKVVGSSAGFETRKFKLIEKANDQFVIIQDGKIDIEKLKDCLRMSEEYLAVFADGTVAVHEFGTGRISIGISKDYNKLNALYKKRKQKEIDKNSIQQQIKKLEEDFNKNVAELRKKLV